MELGEIIKKIREGKGITQKQLAKKVGLPENTVHRYEKEYKDRIPLDRLEILAKALDTTVANVYAYKENPSLLEDPAEYLTGYKRQRKVSVMVELDGTLDNLNVWFATLKRLNTAIKE